ncbi:MAG: phospho-2-dehydro-3-deoxyheptonate aldolase, partial [Spirochaetia bacterium]|nr:phospho-2-dehydro-3-deoxyheptonate aldolase [Spirochaetia bacterium]
MVIVLKKDSTEEQKNNVRNFLTQKNFRLNEIQGEEDTVIAAVGKVHMDIEELELLPGVQKIIPISKPYKMASREFKTENTVVEIPNGQGQTVRIGGQRIVTIAGPSAVESRSQIM